MNLKFINNKKYYVWFCLISGVLTALAFRNKYVWPLNFISFIPLFICILQADLKRKELFKLVMAYSFGYYVILMNWLMTLTPVVPFEGWQAKGVLVLGIVALALLSGVTLFVALIMYIPLKNNTVTDVLVFSALFILGEYIQEFATVIPFPWGRIGVSVTPFTPMIQSASVLGSLFISILVLWFNGVIAYLIKAKCLERKKNKLDKVVITTMICVFFGNILFGVVRMSIVSFNEKDPIDVVLVQGNHSGLEKWNITSKDMMEDYLRLTKEGLDKLQRDGKEVVIWPETAIPTYILDNENIKNTLIQFCKEEDITLFTGAFLENGESDYNSLFQINKDGVDDETYSKQMLVPFGEYLPFRSFFEKYLLDKVQELLFTLNVSKGEESNCLNYGDTKVGGIICYESIFPHIAKELAKNGAEVFFVVSNDSWFGETEALYEHHAHSIMRAVEHSKYLVRASNTAITSIISPIGTVDKTAQRFVPNTLVGTIYPNSSRTIYSYIGDIIIIPSCLMWLMGLIWTARRR